MNLFEAIQEARRQGTNKVSPVDDRLRTVNIDDPELGGISAAEALNLEWEVVPTKKEITLSDLKAAWDRARTNFSSVKSSEQSPLFAALSRELLG